MTNQAAYILRENTGTSGIVESARTAVFTLAEHDIPHLIVGGLAVQEAMSYGLPVIMGQGDGTNDQLVRTGNGWQIRPDDLSALAGSMQTALSDAARLRQMGAESYRIVKDEINLEQMVGVFVKALNSVLVK